MAKAPCKCKQVECEECPEWIFTFADLVMLMMGFFVILWVLKPPAGKSGSTDAEIKAQQEQWYVTVGEIRREVGGWEPDPHSKDPVDVAMIQRMRGTKNGAENEQPRETPPGTDQKLTAIRPGTQAIVGSRLMFDRGSVKLTPETTHLLDETAETIRGHYAIVLVKGHASLDDLADNATPQQRMDLSLRRAQGVADYLLSKGVEADVLRVQGCSTFEPVRQRVYTAEGQTDNRRVEIEWTSQLVTERQDASEKASAPLNEKAPTTQPAARPAGE